MRIIAIDPGYERLGIAVLEETREAVSLIFSECFHTSATLPFSERLHLIGREVERIVETFAPDALAIETLFFTANQKTAMLVSESRGVVTYEAAKKGLRVFEYSPLQVKIAVTGFGRATKESMMAMLPRLVTIPNTLTNDDEYDAIAVGLTCLASHKREVGGKV